MLTKGRKPDVNNEMYDILKHKSHNLFTVALITIQS